LLFAFCSLLFFSAPHTLTHTKNAATARRGVFIIEKRFVSTTLLPKDRYNIVFEDKHWLELDDDGAWLKSLLINLLHDWGAYLETTLFYDAIY